MRGRFDNRPLGDILAECRRAIDRGAREITLVGQTVNAYAEPATGADFADLLHAVAALDGIDRLTFLTSHPKDYTAKLAAAMGAIPQLNPRFHLPVQCGSDPILRRMNRKYTVAQYREKIALFRETCPDWALTTDLIVAFPGESDADFEATLALCDEISFAQAFMFVYSPRRGTPAAHWEQIAPATGTERLKRLAAVVDGHVRAWHERKRGTVVRALVQGPVAKRSHEDRRQDDRQRDGDRAARRSRGVAVTSESVDRRSHRRGVHVGLRRRDRRDRRALRCRRGRRRRARRDRPHCDTLKS